MKDTDSLAYQNQAPLIKAYKVSPEKAMITDVAWTLDTHLNDPFHTVISANREHAQEIKVGLHRAVGGLHDAANPGDLLCAALASCFDSTMRMICDRMGIEIQSLSVKAEADVDVRGTLMVSSEVPVAFQVMRLTVEATFEEDQDKVRLKRVIPIVEHCCVVYRTLKDGVKIEVNVL